MQENFQLKNIGIIRTPFRDRREAPKQGTDHPDSEGRIELFDEYRQGLKDLDTFSHAILIFYFHEVQNEGLTGIPPMDNKERGIFAIRGPHRPNHLGLTIVKIKEINGSEILISGVDMLDKTPLLDIKPYIKELDCREDADSGWTKEYLRNKERKK
jgi:formylmethanofuran dehydrogenase subunit E